MTQLFVDEQKETRCLQAPMMILGKLVNPDVNKPLQEESEVLALLRCFCTYRSMDMTIQRGLSPNGRESSS